jgi:hypothetical protein
LLKLAANTAIQTRVKITLEALRNGFSMRLATFVLNLQISIPIEITVIPKICMIVPLMGNLIVAFVPLAKYSKA